ncbi:tyrosine recombinase XerC [Thaumasiovibrio sp. DFM-14]|uniref:tyrosine recombinase XerC n=1 Tax=Thaumasiovibrio sp. DFM-14 TaxID=3384792 RepID=UPI00399F5FFE
MSTPSELPASLHKPLIAFYQYLRGEKGYSRYTEQSYQQQLTRVAQQMVKMGVTDWRKLDSQWVRQIVAAAKREGLKPGSIALRLSALRSFLDFLVRRQRLKANVAKGVAAPRQDKPLPKNLDVDEINQLLAVDGDDALSVRDRAMMELMYGAGLRLAELVGLDVGDIRLSRGELRVIGKGDKERQVPFAGQAQTWLGEWLKRRKAIAVAGEKAVFVSRHGTRISNRNVQKRMAEWGQKQAVNSHINPHKLRHSYATHMLESSGNLRAVQELLGHANLSTTQIYTHLDFKHLAKVYDEAHPRARRDGSRLDGKHSSE